MNILEFEINGQVLTRIDSQDVMNKNHNIYKCRFTFEEDSEWMNVNKFVIFTDGWGNSSTQHLGKKGNILSCLVPSKMLKGSYFKISVYGGDLITTNNLSISLIQSGYKHHHHFHHGEHHSYDIFVEIFNRLDNTFDSIVYDDSTLQLFCRDELVETIYLPFIREEDIKDLLEANIQEYLTTVDVASSEANGLLSSEDKVKLDSIEYNANHTIVDNELDNQSTNPISNARVTNEFDNINDEIDRLNLDLDGKEDKYDIIERLDNIIIDLINNGD